MLSTTIFCNTWPYLTLNSLDLTVLRYLILFSFIFMIAAFRPFSLRRYSPFLTYPHLVFLDLVALLLFKPWSDAIEICGATWIPRSDFEPTTTVLLSVLMPHRDVSGRCAHRTVHLFLRLLCPCLASMFWRRLRRLNNGNQRWFMFWSQLWLDGFDKSRAFCITTPSLLQCTNFCCFCCFTGVIALASCFDKMCLALDNTVI